MTIELSLATPGSVLASFRADPITRLTLALYCGASSDHNPLHVDIDAARRYGLEDVIAPGMLPMAYLGRLLTSIARPEHLREFEVRFRAPVRVGDTLSCVATLGTQQGDANLLRIDLVAKCQAGQVKMTGRAIISRGEET